MRRASRAAHPQGKLKNARRRQEPARHHGDASIPDAKIFGKGATFKPQRLLRMARSKAYLFGGVEIRWRVRPSLIKDDTPAEAMFHFPGGLKEYLEASIDGPDARHQGGRSPAASRRRAGTARSNGRSAGSPTRTASSTPTATPSRRRRAARTRAGFRAALGKGLRDYGERVGNRKAAQITAEDVLGTARRHALGVHPRAGVPGPDQGQARHPGGDAARRERGARCLRPLAGRPAAAGDEAARMVPSTRPRSG